MLLLRLALGLAFSVLGVIGSFLPIMPGFIFFLLAALVLFPNSAFAAKAIAKIEPRFPRLVEWLRKVGVGVPTEPRDTIRAE
jgi:uncharacterized membrane protein YbaN (DUF454 family)